VISTTLDYTTQCELTRYENNYKILNLITTALGRNVYDRVAHLETAYDVRLKLCNTYECSFEIKSSCKDTYNRQYQTFSQKSGESIDDILLDLSPLSVAYVLVLLLPILTMNVLNNFCMLLMIMFRGMKITALEEYADFLP
jgi:hypothetical protein